MCWLHMWVERGIEFRNSRPEHLELEDNNLEITAFFFFFNLLSDLGLYILVLGTTSVQTPVAD